MMTAIGLHTTGGSDGSGPAAGGGDDDDDDDDLDEEEEDEAVGREMRRLELWAATQDFLILSGKRYRRRAWVQIDPDLPLVTVSSADGRRPQGFGPCRPGLEGRIWDYQGRGHRRRLVR
jgi:hypothetical protein